MRLHRWGRGVAGVVVAVALLGAACGETEAPNRQAGAEPEASSEAFPVTIEHKYGETTIEGAPERVVTVGWTEQDALLALGVVPVGVTDWFGEHPGAIHPWAVDELGDAPLPEVLTDTDGIQFEKIAALQPDLILALYVPFGLKKSDYNLLAQIAPTVAPPADVADGGISWQELTRTAGLAIGKAEEAEELVAGVEAEFAAARDANPDFVGATGLNAYPAEGGNYQAYPPPDPGGRLLADLGFEVPAEIVELADGKAWIDVSSERLDLFDTDVVVWLVETYDRRDELQSDPLYMELNAFKEGRDVFLAYKEDADLAGATSFQSVLSLPFLLEGLVPMLATAIDGDPAT